MGEKDSCLSHYECVLEKRIKAGEVKCPKCGNGEEFMVNEIGHVFCKKCHTKIPMLRLEEKG
jgi:ribosomal protein S27AE